MSHAQAERQTLVSMPAFVTADLWTWEDTDGRLEVYASIQVQATDPCLQPVYDYLADVCFREINWETVEDEGMVLCEAWMTTYAVHTSCPGKGFPHVCRIERIEENTTIGAY